MRRFEALEAEADIALARAEMAKWYEGYSTSQLQEMLRSTCWAPGAKEAIQQLQAAQVMIAIASYTWRFAVEWFAQELNVSHFLGTDLSSGGDIQHVWARDKGEWLAALAAKYGVRHERTAAVGDSVGDAEMLRAVSLRFFVGSNANHDLCGVIHMPGGDLRAVAEHILDEWAS
jgi:phosphoserine phosphatase